MPLFKASARRGVAGGGERMASRLLEEPPVSPEAPVRPMRPVRPCVHERRCALGVSRVGQRGEKPRRDCGVRSVAPRRPPSRIRAPRLGRAAARGRVCRRVLTRFHPAAAA